jgi:hypothetical protein
VAAAAAVSILIVLPFFLPYMQLQQEAGFARTLDESRRWSADWRAWMASPAHAHGWLLGLIGTWKEVLFPGFLATTLGAAGIWLGGIRRSSQREHVFYYLLLAGMALWISFGPDAGLYRVLFDWVPVFTLLRAPARFGILVTLAASVLAAIGLARILNGWRRPALAAAALTVLALAELTSIPLWYKEAPPFAPAYRMLAGLPRGPVVEFPFFWQDNELSRHAYYMINSTAHFQPLVNGYSDYIPFEFQRMAGPLSTFPARESFAILEQLQARYLVFHPDLYAGDSRGGLLEWLKEHEDYLTPLWSGDDVWLYEIVRFPG